MATPRWSGPVDHGIRGFPRLGNWVILAAAGAIPQLLTTARTAETAAGIAGDGLRCSPARAGQGPVYSKM